MILHIDFETRSTLDLKACGVYLYAEHPTTDLWCAAYAFDDGPVELWTPDRSCPDAIFDHVLAGGDIYCHNANFERIVWREILGPRYGWPAPASEQFHCTMAMAYAMALPGSLDAAAAAVGLDAQKDHAGYRLMLQMCRPRRMDGGAPVWWDDEGRRQRLYAYCRADVEAERELHRRLVPLRAAERRIWLLDQKINDRGCAIDRSLCVKAQAVIDGVQAKLDAGMREVTDRAVASCAAVHQLKQWLRGQGVETASVAKAPLEELLGGPGLSPAARRALELRKEAAKASTAKIQAMLDRSGPGGRARGLLQYHGASTGRWAGRGVQIQNLPRLDADWTQADVDAVLKVLALNVKPAEKIAALEMLYGAPLNAIANCLRGLIVAPPGRVLYAVDFANIEGRVLAWLAGEQWKLDAFRAFDAGAGPDLYLVSAARIYGRPVSAFTKKSPERQVGKVAELALGFQGGVGAFQKMAGNYGVAVPDARAAEIKTAWRAAHPAIKRFWWDVEEAACDAVARPGAVVPCGRLMFRKAGSFLWMRLPSGRALCYPYPEVYEYEPPWGGTKLGLRHKGVGTFTKKWEEIDTYGGKLAENATQAVARDILAEAMERLAVSGYDVVFTVHDEVVAEADAGFGSLDDAIRRATILPEWAAGLPIAAEGWAGGRYRK